MTTATLYMFPMRKRKIEWEVIRLRAKGERLGTVEAADKEAALKAAIQTFKLHERDADRLLVRPSR